MAFFCSSSLNIAIWSSVNLFFNIRGCFGKMVLLLNIASVKSALVRSAPERFAPERFAPVRSASKRFAPERFAPESFASERFALKSFALERFAPESFTPLSWASFKYKKEKFSPEQFVFSGNVLVVIRVIIFGFIAEFVGSISAISFAKISFSLLIALFVV